VTRSLEIGVFADVGAQKQELGCHRPLIYASRARWGRGDPLCAFWRDVAAREPEHGRTLQDLLLDLLRRFRCKERILSNFHGDTHGLLLLQLRKRSRD
jgi:hypothetical protein